MRKNWKAYRLPARGWTLAALVLFLSISAGGCSSSRPPASTVPAPAPGSYDEFALDEPEALAPADTTSATPIVPTDESLLAKILRSHPSLQPLEELYVHGGEAYNQRDWDLAEEHFLLLKQKLQQVQDAPQDSLALLYLSSLQRKVDYFAEILAEERFFSDSYAPISLSLEDAYDSLQAHYGIPQFLLPQRPPAEAGSLEELLATDNEMVRRWLKYYQGRGRGQFARWLERYERYGPTMKAILADEGIPEELICAAMIESGLQADIRSRAGAVGWWQFMRSTARHRGLQVDEWIDERRDIEMSTHAAARHFQLLHRMFQDWALALAAYNSGEYRIQRAIGLSGDIDYWTMRLPRETRNYVPKFIAAARIVAHPDSFGFGRIHAEPFRFERIELDDAYSLTQIAKVTGIGVSTLRAYNPQLLAGVTPPGRKNYALRVPVGKSEGALAALSTIPENERITWRKHKLRRGETLGSLARRYHTSVSAIMQINGISNARRVRAGRVLTIPYPRGASIPRTASTKSSPSYTPPPPGKRAWVYTVRKGDTLAGIARHSGSSVTEIRHLNHIRRDRIYPGQELLLHVDQDRELAGARKLDLPEADKTIYTVRRGDTLSGISRRFTVRLADLMRWNHLTSKSRIYPGDRLQILRSSAD